MKKVKYIDIVFENCATARLKPDMFRSLIINGITKRCWINCFQYSEGEVYNIIDCNYFSIEINNKTLETKFESIYGGNLRNRLVTRDITHIDICFSNKESEYITVPWRGKYTTNEAQKLKKFADGIRIEIK